MMEAAELIGLTHERLRQLALEHRDIPTVGAGRSRRFLWPALRKWRDAKLREEGARSVRPQSVEEARRRKLEAEADLMEIELAEKRGLLIPAALYRDKLESAFARVRAHQLNASTRYAPQLLAELADRLKTTDLRRIEEFLDRMMREQMGDLASGDEIPEDDDEMEEPGAA